MLENEEKTKRTDRALARGCAFIHIDCPLRRRGAAEMSTQMRWLPRCKPRLCAGES